MTRWLPYQKRSPVLVKAKVADHQWRSPGEVSWPVLRFTLIAADLAEEWWSWQVSVSLTRSDALGILTQGRSYQEVGGWAREA